MTDRNLAVYNAIDSACTIECHENSPLPPEYEKAYRFTIDLFNPLMYMMTRGIRVDHSALERTRISVRTQIGERQEELNKTAGRALNPNSPKDIQTYFYIEKGIAPYFSRRKKDGTGGGVTTDDKALQRIYRKTHLREAKLVQELRGLQKLLGTYLEITFDPDSRLRCAYNPRGTKNGRLSSSETVFGTGTNNQNLPPEFKQFLCADEGYVLIEPDKRHAEWVVMAYLTGDANMIRVVQEGRDPHVYTASLMFKAEEDLVVVENRLVGNSTDAEFIEEIRAAKLIGIDYDEWPRTMSMRQCGKKSNHGLNYDEGYSMFSLVNEMLEGEGKRVIELYHSIYPGIRIWYGTVQSLLRNNRTLTNCFGRPRTFLNGWGDELFKDAYAYLPQSTVVDGLNQGLLGIYNDKDPDVALTELLAQVHDSILFQFPIAHLDSLYRVLHCVDAHCSPEMYYNGRSFKIPTDFKIGLNWGTYSDDNLKGMQEISVDDEEEFDKELRLIRYSWARGKSGA